MAGDIVFIAAFAVVTWGRFALSPFGGARSMLWPPRSSDADLVQTPGALERREVVILRHHGEAMRGRRRRDP